MHLLDLLRLAAALLSRRVNQYAQNIQFYSAYLTLSIIFITQSRQSTAKHLSFRLQPAPHSLPVDTLNHPPSQRLQLQSPSHTERSHVRRKEIRQGTHAASPAISSTQY
jgi:hypothetical protein